MTDQADDRSLPGEVADMPPEERAAGLREGRIRRRWR
jgi:hypothetical protein